MHPESAQAAPIFPAWGQSGPVLFPGGGYQRLRQLSLAGCAAHPFRMATVLDGVPEDGAVPHHHRIPQNQLPDGIGDVACLGGLAKSKPGHLLVHNGDVPQRGRGLHPAVVLQPLLHPAIVEAIRHQLQDGLAGPDLEEAGAPSPGAPPGLPFCLRDEFPRGDGAQDQATLHVRPEDMLRLSRIVLLPVVLAHHAVDIVRCDGGVDDPLIP